MSVQTNVPTAQQSGWSNTGAATNEAVHIPQANAAEAIAVAAASIAPAQPGMEACSSKFEAGMTTVTVLPDAQIQPPSKVGGGLLSEKSAVAL